MVDADYVQIAELLQRFLKERAGKDAAATTGRTVGQLLRAAEAYTTERKRVEAERRAKEKARREREAAIAREKHLDSLVGREGKLWTEVDSLVATKQPKNYDQAARGKCGDFGLRIGALRQAQAKKPSFIERLRKAGL